MSREQNYTPLDRLLHRVAFAGPGIQLTAADVESRLYSSRFRDVAVRNPVFITSVPRAGTTLLLEVFDQFPESAIHCYRDMPFVLSPLLWDSLSSSFRKQAVLKERAHGDGMAVGYDSPEAFEEILWRAFWPEKFQKNRIGLWEVEEVDEEFREFFVDHMRKIVALRSIDEGKGGRYVSKNNANISRLGLLRRLFPDSLILIPFRHPLEQATSLFGQHRRFLELHGTDPFSKRYMRDIGHLEFGELHRPIAFDGIDDLLERHSPDALDYWVAYWVLAFEHILKRKEDVVLLGYERACEDGPKALEALAAKMDIGNADLRASAAGLFRTPNYRGNESDVRDKRLLETAYELHESLSRESIV